MRLACSLLCLILVGCAQRDPEAEARALDVAQRALVTQDLGGGCTIERVNPPAGPFRLVSRGSLYYKATARDGQRYYAEVYVSYWTAVPLLLGGGDAVYRRRYYQQTLGVWHRVLR